MSVQDLNLGENCIAHVAGKVMDRIKVLIHEDPLLTLMARVSYL